jgi:hypothetical protein
VPERAPESFPSRLRLSPPEKQSPVITKPIRIRRWQPVGLLPFVILALGCPVGRVGDADLMTLIAADKPSVAAPTAETESASASNTQLIASGMQASITNPQPSEPSPRETIRREVAEVLRLNREHRKISSEVNAAWQVMHGVLAYGKDFVIQTAEGPKPAVEYALGGGTIKGFLIRGGDRFDIGDRSVRGVVADLDPGAKIGQGHRDQWVAYMARSGLVDSDTVMSPEGELTVEGWIRQAEWDVPLNFEAEYSWTLTALVTHRPTTHRWTARDGQQYSIESLLASEIRQLSPSSACGGSHRLCAIANALNRHRAAGLPVTGVWADAEQIVDLAIEQAHDFRNADGSFSSHYFDRPGWSPDLVASLGTTGHVFEFLAVAGSDELLNEPWVRHGAEYLCKVLRETAHIDLECGALYHALSGLSIYEERLR